MASYPSVTLSLRLLLASALACAWAGASAQSLAAPALDSAAPEVPRAGERLSQWLLRQPLNEQAYPIGLSWRVPGERPEQLRLKRQLLAELERASERPTAARSSLRSLIEALPVTGRVPLPRADARWLQAHPRQDPVLSAEHRLVLPARPSTVFVVTDGAQLCAVGHRAGAQIRDYLAACEPQSWLDIDRVWVVQPDGSVYDYGTAHWNRQAQDELAPGAMVWAPKREGQPTPEFSLRLAQFLATQSQETLLAGKAVSPIDLATGPHLVRQARGLPLTANNWGKIGLMQTPTARLAPAGDFRFNYSRIEPYERLNVFVQPIDELELGFRYTNVLNRLYGPAELSGNQTYKDKSIDFKLRLWQETAFVPQVAVGITDAGGTGLFSSEYLVASKRFGDLDASLGIAWGYLGSSGNIGNPLTRLSPRFGTRSSQVGWGGTPSTSAFFRGPAALFGGLQYHAPWRNWVLKAEYDGNDYSKEPQGQRIKPRTPLNLGVVYRYHPQLDLSLSLERGNAVMFGLTLHTSVAGLYVPKVSDPVAPRVGARPLSDEPIWAATAIAVSEMSQWGVSKIEQAHDNLLVHIDSAGGAHWEERVDRIAAVLHRDAAPNITAFKLVISESGLPVTERLILRAPWVRQNSQYLPPSEREQAVVAAAPALKAGADQQVLWERPASPFGYAIVPSWQQNIGGPDGFLLFRLGVSLPMSYRLSENTSITGAVDTNLVDTFDKFKYTAPSNLPRVRTYLREYMKTSRFNLPNLQITHTGRLTSNQFFSAYAGYLESMYAGVGGEWLYRPWHSPLAVGVDLNRVRQRDFDQHFGFGKAGSQTGYQTTTGHATTYWDTGWKSTRVKLSVGRYLAGDVGATLDVSRTFSNGVSVGAWATRTNVSAEQFGEGSFDKGLYLRIPFDVLTTTRGGSVANLVYSPLTRDGGARLNRAFSLYGATLGRSLTDTGFGPAYPHQRQNAR